MIKLVCFMNRRPDMSMEAFKDYYENHHVPLINGLMPFWQDYRRNFLVNKDHAAAHMAPGRPTGAIFDVMTELTFVDEEMHQKCLDALADPVIGKIIAEDEEKLFDRKSMRTFIVDERCSVK